MAYGHKDYCPHPGYPCLCFDKEKTLSDKSMALILDIMGLDEMTNFMKMDAICKLCDEYRERLGANNTRKEVR